MPRIKRLDWKDAIHHVMSRGIEKRLLFRDDRDRSEFATRLLKCVSDTDVVIYAWVLMPNHFHLLLKTGDTALSQFMRKLLTGYALYFNNRHDRVGHLFQNRYKSILVQEDLYFQKLVKYIHLNPLQAGIVNGQMDLTTYKWSGHYELMNRVHPKIIKADKIYEMFGNSNYVKNGEYLSFLFSEDNESDDLDFDEGLHLIGSEGLLHIDDAKKEKVDISKQHRILGNRNFAKEIFEKSNSVANSDFRNRSKEHESINKLFMYVEENWFVTKIMLESTSRRKRITHARVFLCNAFVEYLGLSYVDSGRLLNISKQAVHQNISRISSKAQFNTLISHILDK